MKATGNFYYKNFQYAALISMGIAVLLFAGSFLFGKTGFFLLLNGDGGQFADFFFKWITYAGDGALWFGWLIFLALTRKWKWLPLLITAVVLSTLFTQLSKKLILPGELRPSAAIAQKELFHVVEGVTVHGHNSFPSGHTTTAFSLALLIVLLVPGRFVIFPAIVVAALAGYSRVYLAQHFPLDVAAGIVTAVLSVYLSVKVQQQFEKKWQP